MKNLFVVATLAFVLATGCKKKDAGTESQQKGPPATCEAAIATLIETDPKMGAIDLPDAAVTGWKLRVPPLAVEACKENGWADATRGCLARAKDKRGAEECRAELSADQVVKLGLKVEALKKELTAAVGSGG